MWRRKPDRVLGFIDRECVCWPHRPWVCALGLGQWDRRCSTSPRLPWSLALLPASLQQGAAASEKGRLGHGWDGLDGMAWAQMGCAASACSSRTIANAPARAAPPQTWPARLLRAGRSSCCAAGEAACRHPASTPCLPECLCAPAAHCLRALHSAHLACLPACLPVCALPVRTLHTAPLPACDAPKGLRTRIPHLRLS